MKNLNEKNRSKIGGLIKNLHLIQVETNQRTIKILFNFLAKVLRHFIIFKDFYMLERREWITFYHIFRSFYSNFIPSKSASILYCFPNSKSYCKRKYVSSRGLTFSGVDLCSSPLPSLFTDVVNPGI